MKRIVSYPVLFFILSVLYTSAMPIAAQPTNNWVKYWDNPVLDVGDPGEWDSGGVNFPDIYFDGFTYKMWYTGATQLNTARIGYATSSDGTNWIKDITNNPVLTPDSSAWDSLVVVLPVVIFDGTIYKMWYGGGGPGSIEVGYATSPDGISWTKDSANPVINVGLPGEWDDAEVNPGTVIFDGSTYKMWYGGRSQGPSYQIGYATSSDGINWVKDITNNPVLMPGNPGEWDDLFVYTPDVIWDGVKYHMWYFGRGGTPLTSGIGYATSSDGVNWEKDTTNNPVLRPGDPGEWDDNIVAHPKVIITNTVYRMWYTGNDGINARIGLATDSIPVGISDKDITAIRNFSLSQNYPNPFNPTTSIDYTLPKSSPVKLKIFSLLGQEIRALVDEHQSAGTKTVVWDGRDNLGRLVSSGIYVYRLQADNEVRSRKMLLVR